MNRMCSPRLSPQQSGVLRRVASCGLPAMGAHPRTLRTLREAGLIRYQASQQGNGWYITDAGREVFRSLTQES